MSNIQYGLISKTDARTLEKTIDLIFQETNMINIAEIGLYNCETTKGLQEYCSQRYSRTHYTGIDNLKDKTTDYVMQNASIYDQLIIGNSNEVYNQLEDNSQHLIFIDGLHTFAGVVSDFFCYAPKVKGGGYMAFHDTGKHINPLHGWQGVGDKNDPDMCLGGVRKALEKIGLLWDADSNEFIDRYAEEWELVFDEADPNDEAGGICVFKKLN